MIVLFTVQLYCWNANLVDQGDMRTNIQTQLMRGIDSYKPSQGELSASYSEGTEILKDISSIIGNYFNLETSSMGSCTDAHRDTPPHVHACAL